MDRTLPTCASDALGAFDAFLESIARVHSALEHADPADKLTAAERRDALTLVEGVIAPLRAAMDEAHSAVRRWRDHALAEEAMLAAVDEPCRMFDVVMTRLWKLVDGAASGG